MKWLTMSGTTRSYPPQPSVSHSWQLVLPSVLTNNSINNRSVCLPTRAAKINPLVCAKLNATQQSPTWISSGWHCFCFFLQTTRTRRLQSDWFQPLAPPGYAPFALSHSLLGLRSPQCHRPAHSCDSRLVDYCPHCALAEGYEFALV